MDACGTALRLGLPFAIHSDAPVTPLGTLFTAWCAANRRTASGVLLEQIAGRLGQAARVKMLAKRKATVSVVIKRF